MRKVTVILLILSAILTSCNNLNASNDTNPDAAEESQKKKTQSEIPCEPVTEESDEIPNGATFFRIAGELPDIGKFSGSSYDSYFDEPVYSFVPGDYDGILPYIDSVKDFDGMKRFSYGLCDRNGKIVMDAAYSNVSINYMSDEKGNGIYRITKAPKEETDMMFSASETVIVDGNGKWTMTINGWCDNMYDGIFLTSERNPETNEIKNVVYGYDGEEILCLDDYDYVSEYGCGLLCANKWEDDTSKFFFINLDGDVVLGPYSTAFGFNEYGFAPVTDFEDNAHIIDTNGRKYTDNIYSNASFQTGYKGNDGVFVMTKKGVEGEYDIFSADAQLLGSISDEKAEYVSLRLPESGEIIYNYTVYGDKYENSESIWKRVSDGSELVSKELGIKPNRYIGNDDFYVCATDDDKAYVIDCYGETVAVLDDYSDESMTFSGDGRFIAYNAGKYNFGYDSETGEYDIDDSRRFKIYDSVEKKIVYEADRAGYAYFVGDDERYMKVSLFTDVDMFAVNEHYVLFDTETETVLFDNCTYIEAAKYYGDWYYNVCTENSCTLYDKDFNAIRKSYYE